MFVETPGIVIKRTKMQESDVMVTLFTRDLGLIRVVANGARHPKSRLSSSTQTFVFGVFSINMGSQYNRLTNVDMIRSNNKISQDFTVMIHGSYFSELILKSVGEHQVNKKLFSLFVEIVDIIQRDEVNLLLMKTAFELKHLKLLGYEIMVRSCAKCGKTDDIEFFSVKEGGMICVGCNESTYETYRIGETLPKLITYLTNKDIRIIVNTKIADEYLQKLQTIIKQYYQMHLNIGGLKSLEFLDVAVYEETKKNMG